MGNKKSFEKIIKENEKFNKRIRGTFFPLITEGMITGYNIYENLFDYTGANIFLNYLHSDLNSNDKHYKEITNILEKEGLTNNILNISHELVDSKEIKERNAIYLTRPEWEDSPRMRYFLFDGTEISIKQAEELGIDVIGEVMQYDMVLKLKNETELRRITNLLKKYVAKFKIDEFGRKIKDANGNPSINNNAISNAWDIPLIICTTRDNKKPSLLKDFLKVNQFNIKYYLKDIPIIISTLVRKKHKNLKNFLLSDELKFNIKKKYALRTFVEDYIDT